MLLDSNILIYAAAPEGEFLIQWVEDASAAIASVTRIETLGFPGWNSIVEAQRTELIRVLGTLLELPLDSRVIGAAIALRQTRKISLADAIIAATALVHRLPLITRNERDFREIDGLTVMNPFAAG